jgi:TetR/AcrR family transcriptional regulator, tetracycline repressor protein
VTLSRERVVDAALAILRDHGLASLSMRQVAAALGVQPGAIYWHVKSKQDLLALLADRILSGSVTTAAVAPTAGRLRQQAGAVRAALLQVRDGAEVVSFAQALRPQALAPMRMFHDTLATALPDPQAEWGARTLTHYVLGEVAEEQNYAELARAGIVSDREHFEYSAETFLFGVDAILEGLLPSTPRKPGKRKSSVAITEPDR